MVKQVDKITILTYESFLKAGEVNEGLDSFSFQMNLTQKMDGEGDTFETQSDLSMDIITDPLSMKQSMVSDLGEFGEQEMEIYLCG